MSFFSLANRSSLLRSGLAVVIALAPLSAVAQFTSGIQGTVTDTSNGVVPKSRVTLTNVDTGVSQNGRTNNEGLYYFNRLSPGNYTITVEAAGYQTSKVNAKLTTDQLSAVDVKLSLGKENTIISVTAESSQGLNTDETRLQYTLGTREISDLPLPSRATLSLLRVAPGVTGVQENDTNITVNRTQPNANANGRSSIGNLYLLDNIPVNSELASIDGNGNGSFGSVSIVPNPDMIAEIALQTTTFSVENSASSSLQTSLTTKSGTNLFHGDVDYTYTGTPFGAVGDFQAPTPFRHQFVSAALGGPIWKDHTFFFGDYQNQQISSPTTGVVQDETDQFVAWAQTVYPNSQNLNMGMARFRPTAATGVTISQYGRDADPTNCDTAAIYVPCGLPVVQSGLLATATAINGSQYIFRLDHAIRDGNDKFYASFFRFDQNGNSPSERPGFDGQTPSTAYYLAAGYVHVFTSNLLNQANFGATRFAFDFTPTPHSQEQVTVPYLNLVGGSFPGIIPKFVYSLKEHAYYGRDVVSYVKGKHSLTFGFQGSYVNENDDHSSIYGRPFLQLAGSYTTFLNDISNLEQIYTLSAQTGKFVPQYFGSQTTRYGLYAQDAWKVTPNLLITAGIRWDDFGNPTNYGPLSQPYANVFLANGPNLIAQAADASSEITGAVFSGRLNKNFLPRASFAYAPTADKKLSIHGGVGLYEDDVNLQTVSGNLSTQPPVRLSLALGPYGGGPIPALVSYGTNDVTAPYGFQFPTIPINGFTPRGGLVGVPTGLYGVSRDLTPEKTLLFNAGIDQQVGQGLVFGLLYSGSHSYDQYVTTDLNTFNGRTYSGVRPNTDFQAIDLYRNQGYGNYNALIATVRDHIGTLDFQASYTWAHSLGTPINYYTDQTNLSSQYANTAADVRNRFTLSEVYEVPRLFHNRAANEIIGGINISNILVAESGTPFTVADANGGSSYADDFNQDGTGIDLPNYNGKRRGGWSRNQFRAGVFNSVGVNNVFTAPTPGPGVEGNAGINSFGGPGYFDLDSTISKRILLPWFRDGHSSLVIRAEALNTINRANLQLVTALASGDLNASTYQVGNPNATIGQAQAAGQPRIIQIGGRFEF
jgi:Carboxypeptidase regulatory-like domain